ncbi:MAG TPA: hypothetical protein VLK65_27370 [Vicinamibacteria bacterium]|nr:hypothetical protein [Vicinamibacteria bacterium]
MKPNPIAVFCLLLGLASSVAASNAPRVVVLNLYYAKQGSEEDVLETRLEASRVRGRLGLPRGRVLRRIQGPDSLPEVIWECEFEDVSAHDRDMDARAASHDFEAVRTRMGTLLERFERSLWELRHGGIDGVDVPAISVLNAYYPSPGREEDVLSHRVHASEVRGSLGFPEGRVLHRISEGVLPTVLWQMDYVDLEARRRDSDGVGATAEFQEVMEKMGTLIRHFERGVFEVVSESRRD